MIWALHGFLGRGADWEVFREGLEEAAGTELRAPDLLAKPIPEEPPEAWAKRFVRAVRRIDEAPLLVGYSMGARLALHALLDPDARFRAAVLISAGLGVEGEVERQMRRVRDDRWAARFEEEPWNQVVRAWDAQPVLQGSAEPGPRLEPNFDRSALATALRWWSPAVQKPLASRLPEIAVPLLWIAGERDEAYARIARAAARDLPSGELWIAPGAGHRVPWDAPEEFANRISAFLAKGRFSSRNSDSS